MNPSNNFNYPGIVSVTTSGGGGGGGGGNPIYAPSNTRYAMFTDDIRGWRGVPKKTIANPYGAGFVTIIPLVPEDAANDNFQYFPRRQLWMNLQTSPVNLQLPTIIGKQWCLDSVSIYAYDRHESLPSIQITQLLAQIPGITTAADLRVDNGWSSGIAGYIIGWNIDNIVTWLPDETYTTAAYPDFGYIETDETPAGVPAQVGAGQYGRNWLTWQNMAQNATRSGVVGGSTTTDWLPNQFAFNISGADAPTEPVTGLSKYLWGSDVANSYVYGTGNYMHTPLPVQVSNLGIQCDYPYLGVEIYGPGYFHYLPISADGYSQTSSSVYGISNTIPPIRTVVQMPVTCTIIMVANNL